MSVALGETYRDAGRGSAFGFTNPLETSQPPPPAHNRGQPTSTPHARLHSSKDSQRVDVVSIEVVSFSDLEDKAGKKYTVYSVTGENARGGSFVYQKRFNEFAQLWDMVSPAQQAQQGGQQQSYESLAEFKFPKKLVLKHTSVTKELRRAAFDRLLKALVQENAYELQVWLKDTSAHQGARVITSNLIERAHVSCPRVEEVPSALDEGMILDLMKTPTVFLKFGSVGNPHWRIFALSADEAFITYRGSRTRKKDTAIPVSSIKAIVRGQTTSQFKRVEMGYLENVSMSILYSTSSSTGTRAQPNASLNIVGQHPNTVRTWMHGIAALLARHRGGQLEESTAVAGSDLQAAPTTAAPVPAKTKRPSTIATALSGRKSLSNISFIGMDVGGYGLDDDDDDDDDDGNATEGTRVADEECPGNERSKWDTNSNESDPGSNVLPHESSREDTTTRGRGGSFPNSPPPPPVGSPSSMSNSLRSRTPSLASWDSLPSTVAQTPSSSTSTGFLSRPRFLSNGGLDATSPTTMRGSLGSYLGGASDDDNYVHESINMHYYVTNKHVACVGGGSQFSVIAARRIEASDVPQPQQQQQQQQPDSSRSTNHTPTMSSAEIDSSAPGSADLLSPKLSSLSKAFPFRRPSLARKQSVSGPESSHSLSSTSPTELPLAQARADSVKKSSDVHMWCSGRSLACALPAYGNRSAGSVPSPRPVGALKAQTQIRAVACGEGHALMNTLEGDLFSFGCNAFGQCGLGHTRDTDVAMVLLPGNHFVRHVAAGDAFSAIICEVRREEWLSGDALELEERERAEAEVHGGRQGLAHNPTHVQLVYTWGCGMGGTLGHGDESDRHAPTLVSFFDPNVYARRVRALEEAGQKEPVGSTAHAASLRFGASVTGVAAGGMHMGVLVCPAPASSATGSATTRSRSRKVLDMMFSDGTDGSAAADTPEATRRLLWMWGHGAQGQLGLGHCEDALSPQLVETLAYKDIRQIACGVAHTAAIVDVASGPMQSMAIRGRLYTWGAGLQSQGAADAAHVDLPRHFNFTKRGHYTNVAEQIACGDHFTAVLDDEGRITIIGLSPITGKPTNNDVGMGSGEAVTLPKEMNVGDLRDYWDVETLQAGGNNVYAVIARRHRP